MLDSSIVECRECVMHHIPPVWVIPDSEDPFSWSYQELTHVCSDVETLSKLHQIKGTADQVVLFPHGRIVDRATQRSLSQFNWDLP